MSYKYSFDKEKCMFRKTCTGFPESCKETCIPYMKMDYAVSVAGIPEEKRFPARLTALKDVEAFSTLRQLKYNMKDFVESGKTLLIQSPNPGNGKTTWSLILLLSYLDRVWPSVDFETIPAMFLQTYKVFSMLKSEISADYSIQSQEEWKDIKRAIYNSKLIVWDDLASTKLTAFEKGKLLEWLEHRSLWGLSSIFTTNLIDEDLRDCLGDRLYSRIVNGSSNVVTFKNEDMRGY